MSRCFFVSPEETEYTMSWNGYTYSSGTLVEMTLTIVLLVLLDVLLLVYLVYPSVRRLFSRTTKRTPKETL